jgi:hypothetical protein
MRARQEAAAQPSRGEPSYRHPARRAGAAPRAARAASGALDHVGGSRSHHWNDLIARETAAARSCRHAGAPLGAPEVDAAVAGLAGIAPQNETEGMMAAQLIAAHGAAMDCYRRAMIDEERDENLRHAHRLSRGFLALLAALHRYRASRPRGEESAEQPHAKGAALPAPATTVGSRTKSAEQPHAKEQADAPVLRRCAQPLAPEPTRKSAEQPQKMGCAPANALSLGVLLAKPATIAARYDETGTADCAALLAAIAKSQEQPHAKGGELFAHAAWRRHLGR